MALRLTCPDCRFRFLLPDRHTSRRVQCPECQRVFRVGAEAAPEPERVEDKMAPVILMRARLAALGVLLLLVGAGIGYLVRGHQEVPGRLPAAAKARSEERPARGLVNALPHRRKHAPEPPDIVLDARPAPVPAPPEVALDLWQVRPDPPPAPVEVPAAIKVSIPVPGGDGVILPTTPSWFVAVGQNEAPTDICEVWNLGTMKRAGEIRGRLNLTKPFVLSPDGLYLAGKAAARPDAVEVWSFATGLGVRSFKKAHLLDFAGPGQFLTFKQGPGGNLFQVWDLASGQAVRNIVGPPVWVHDWRRIALSPGRRFLALTAADKLLVYDLTTGATAGDVRLPDAPGGASSVFCQGLAFTPDGTELAGLFVTNDKSRLLSWKIGPGKLVENHLFSTELIKRFQNSFSDHGRPLEWLPDHSGWLLYGKALMNRGNGRVAGLVEVDRDDLWMGPRKILDRDRVLVVAGLWPNRTVETLTLPGHKIGGVPEHSQAGAAVP
jgi:hypothetical protein